MIVSLKTAADQNVVGKKAAALSLLSQKYPVPQGFVVTADTFSRFVELHGINKKARELLADVTGDKIPEIASTIQKMIADAVLPEIVVEELHDAYYSLNIDETHSLQQIMDSDHEPLVAVRPSPLHGIRGLHASFLGVRGIENLKKAILECWASFYCEDAIACNAVKDQEFAVIVQKMIESTASGTLHTSYKMNSGEVLIYGCKGLGTALSTGLVVPDRYFITKHSLNIASIEIGKQPFMIEYDKETNKIAKVYLQEEYSKKQKISDKHIGELTLYSKEIEELFGMPMEIEFAIYKDIIYFVNAVKTELQQQEKKRVQMPEETKEEIEKKEQEISTVLTQELENDVLVVNALNPQEQICIQKEPVFEQPHSIVADSNDINAIILGIDFSQLIEEAEAVGPSSVQSYVFADEQKQQVSITENVVQEEQKHVEIGQAVEKNKKELSLFEKAAGELIVHCFKEIKNSLPREQWSSSPELRHLAVLAHNYSQKNVAPSPAQVKLAMSAVEKVKNR